MTAVESLCSRVIWLDRGRVREVGDAASVIRDYLTAGAGHGGDVPARIDLRDAPRGWTVEMARIHSLTFVREHANDRSPWHIGFGEPFALEFEFTLARHDPAVVLGIGIRNDRGEDVLTSHSVDKSRVTIPPRPHASARVAIESPWLRPGSYHIEVAVLSGMQLLDHVRDAAVLVVEEQSAPGAPPLALKKGPVSPLWNWSCS